MRRPRPTTPLDLDRRPGELLPVILDVDTGIDDSLALLYAAGHPGIDLVAVTACGGNVELDQVVHNTLGVLALGGAAHVPVAPGARHPIARALQTTPDTHGPTGTGYAVLPPTADAERRSAVATLVEHARARPGEITLVTMGPLTNLASALLAEPDLPVLLRDVFVMGGTFGEAGNVLPRVEWNIYVDPEAARVVFHQWSQASPRGVRPIVVMGLDVTETSIIRAEDLARAAEEAGFAVDVESARRSPEEFMARPIGSPVLDFARDALRFYFEFHHLHDGFYGAHVHDPFVLGAALDPTLVRAAATVVDVELGGTHTAGETVADWRGHLPKPVNAHVATEGDGPAFVARLVQVLADLGRLPPALDPQGGRPARPRC